MDRAVNYYCTWNTQNFGRVGGQEPSVCVGTEGAKAARNRLNEAFIFGEGGLADQYAEIRKELYFLLDDGWDVPYDVHPDTQITAFGSLILSNERFPSFSGSPAQRLKKLNQALKDRGWKGAALWVAAHGAGESPESGLMTVKEAEGYWGDRLRWCAEAGIGYWKVDWGFHQFDPEWKAMITVLRDRLAPGLHIEHSYPAASPLNNVVLREDVSAGDRQTSEDRQAPGGSRALDGPRTSESWQTSDGRFAGWEDYPAKWGQAVKCSEIFRTYDVLQKFAPVSTLDRVETLMQENPEADVILNCEDEVYLGAVLGCSLGIMRSGLCAEVPGICFDPRGTSRRLDEVIRAVNWQKTAPPFPIREGIVRNSGELFTETGVLSEGEFWEKEYLGKEIFQKCRSVVTRNMELPGICYYEERKPVIVAARHPGGAVSILSLPCHQENGAWRTPGAEIALEGIRPGTPVGVFGHWSHVILSGLQDLDNRRVWARDLKDETWTDITERCCMEDSQIRITGEALESVCRNARGDISEPGVCLEIC